VSLSPAGGCQRPFRLIAAANASDYTPEPLFTVTGPRAKLYLSDIRLMLGSRRQGIAASGGFGTLVSLTRVTISSGRAERGGALSATNAAVQVSRSRFSSNRATAEGGAIYVTAPAGGVAARFKALQMSDSVVTGNRVRPLGARQHAPPNYARPPWRPTHARRAAADPHSHSPPPQPRPPHRPHGRPQRAAASRLRRRARC
jgi:hypothetical protein